VNQYKKYINNIIDQYRKKIIDFGQDIYENSEMGYAEYRTRDKVEDIFRKLKLKIEVPLALTGVKAVFRGKYEGPTLAILGEMDGLKCKDHPFSNPETNSAHICGHNAQLTAMIGAAYALVNSKIQEELHGNIVFMATPAEEYVEIEKRQKLKKDNKIKYLAGKPELIRIGAFDDVDIALITHVGSDIRHARFGLGGSTNGFLAKRAHFVGKAAHAGGAPDKGRNALQAANIAINAINAWRESFKDDHHIRVHPILTKAGSHVNIVPDQVKLETYVRGKTLDSILETNKKVNKSLKAGAMAMGCKVIIDDTPGFLPQKSSSELVDVIHQNAESIVGDHNIVDNGHFDGSSDMGDLTSIMPGTIIEVGGIKGSPHTKEFHIVNEQAAYIKPSKLLAMTAVDLLINSSNRAQNIIDSYNPDLSKSEYMKLIDSFFKNGQYDYFSL